MSLQLTFAEKMVFESSVSFDDLPPALDGLLEVPQVVQVNAEILMRDRPLTDGLGADRFVGGDVAWQLLHVCETCVSVLVSATIGREHRREVEGPASFVRIPGSPEAWVLVHTGNRDFVNGPLKRLLRSLRPYPVRPLLSTMQVRAVFNRLAAAVPRHDMRITQVGSRGSISSEGAIRAVESNRQWTDMLLEDAFRELQANGDWVVDTTARYKVGRQPASFRLSRRSTMTFRGAVAPIFRDVTQHVAELGARNYFFLHGRQRSEENGYRSRPFRIDFGKRLLAAPGSMESLRGSLTSIPHVSCTVVHGNPYFHAALVDYTDGSCLEVLVYDDSALTIIPQGRTTVRALQRVASTIFSRFREGALEELPGG